MIRLKAILLFLIATLLLPNVCFSKTFCDNFLMFKNVKIIKVIDGDTFEINYGRLPITIRLTGVDAFESKKHNRINYQIKQTGLTEEEILKKGNKAKEYFKKNYSEKEVCLILNKDHLKDPYGRYLGIIIDNGNCEIDNQTKIFQQIIIDNNFGLKDYRYKGQCEEIFLFEQIK